MQTYGIENAGNIITNILSVTSAIELTIDSTGSINISQSLHTVDTFENDSSSDLITIDGELSGQFLLIRASDPTRTIVVKETGNILTGGSDISLDNTNKYLLFMYDNGLSKWVITGGSGAGGGAGMPQLWFFGG